MATADYTTVENVLAYKGTESADYSDDVVIADVITRMSREFDRLTDRQAGAYAVAGSPSTFRYFDGYNMAGLAIDECVSIDEVATSADGGGTFTAWAGSDYLTSDGREYDAIPIRRLQIAPDSAKTKFPAGTRGVRVQAVWGRSLTTPDDVEHAVIRMVEWALGLRAGAAGQNSSIVTDVGVVLSPTALPDDVQGIVRAYRWEKMAWAR